MNIIDNPIDLTKLSEQELDELLLDQKYNNQNLRQLVRMCIVSLNTQIKLSVYNLEKSVKYQKQISQIKELLGCHNT